MAIFFLQKFVIFNIFRSFFIRGIGTVERPSRYVCKNVLTLGCQDSVCFAFFKLLKNEESFWKSFSCPFSAKCFDGNFKYLLLKIYFPLIFLTVTNIGGICILKACL